MVTATLGPTEHPPHSHKDEGGVTLVELLIAMMLMLVVMAAVYGVWGRLQNTYAFTEQDMRAQAEVREALGEMIEYIRTARIPASTVEESLNAVIPQADPFEIWLWTDIDRDPNHDLELVRFWVQRNADGTTALNRQESPGGDGNWDGAPVRVVDQNVRNGGDGATLDSTVNPLFVYSDVNGDPLLGNFDVTLIRTIGIDLRIDIDVDRAPVVHELSSVVQPRNLRQY